MRIDLLLTLLTVWLLLWTEHWFPWRLMLRKDLPRLVAYILGVLALHVPLTGLYIYWASSGVDVGEHAHLVALWVVTVGGGLAVLSAYGIDWLLDNLARRYELDELLRGREDAAGPTDE